MSNGALRAAMWSLLCAVGLLGALSVGDPRAIQTAFLSEQNAARVLAAAGRTESQPLIGPELNALVASVEMPAPEVSRQPDRGLPSMPSEPRIATADMNQLRLERENGSVAWVNHGAKRSDGIEIDRPAPQPIDTGMALNVERPVPDPAMFDPFDEPEPAVVLNQPPPADEIADEVIAGLKDEITSLKSMIAEQATLQNATYSAGRFTHVPVWSAAPLASPIAPVDSHGNGESPIQKTPEAIAIGGGRFNLTLAGCELPDIVKLLGELCDKNVVIEDGLDGIVRYDLRGISVIDALRILSRTHSIAVTEEPGLIYVGRPQPEPQPADLVAETDVPSEPVKQADKPMMIVEPGAPGSSLQRIAAESREPIR